MKFVIIILALLAAFIINVIIASNMEIAAEKKGYGKEAYAFAMCFWLGIVGYLYVVALPDLKQHEQLDKIIKLLDPQTPTTAPQQDVAWKLQELIPEAPKKDGRAEAYLREIGMSSEDYKCKSLVVFGENPLGECAVCKKQQKITKHCGIRRNGAFNDIPVCTDCINVFIEYNPSSVFNFEPKETKQEQN